MRIKFDCQRSCSLIVVNFDNVHNFAVLSLLGKSWLSSSFDRPVKIEITLMSIQINR